MARVGRMWTTIAAISGHRYLISQIELAKPSLASQTTEELQDTLLDKTDKGIMASDMRWRTSKDHPADKKRDACGLVKVIPTAQTLRGFYHIIIRYKNTNSNWLCQALMLGDKMTKYGLHCSWQCSNRTAVTLRWSDDQMMRWCYNKCNTSRNRTTLMQHWCNIQTSRNGKQKRSGALVISGVIGME